MAKKKRPLARRPRPTSGAASSNLKSVAVTDGPPSDDVADEASADVVNVEAVDTAALDEVMVDEPGDEAPEPTEQVETDGDSDADEAGADEPTPEQRDSGSTQEQGQDTLERDEIALDDALGDPNEEDDVYTGPTLVEDGPSLNEGEIENIEAYLKGLVEAILFSSDKPQTAKDVARAARLDKGRVQELIDQLISDTQDRGVRLVAVADGYAFRTNPVYSAYVREFLAQRPVRLSRAQLETLAIIAYRQPLTRPEVDDIRGVDSGAVIKLLLERDLIRVLGKKDEPGRPMIYGTTSQFLELFSLSSLRDLPTLREFTELSDDSRAKFELEVGEPAPQGPIDFAGYDAFVEGEGPSVSATGSSGEQSDMEEIASESELEEQHSRASETSDDETDDPPGSGPPDSDEKIEAEDGGEFGDDDLDSAASQDDPDDETYVPPASAADEEEFPDDEDDDDDSEDDDDEDDDDDDDDD